MKNLPIRGIAARAPTAIILSFYGKRAHVERLMLSLSHCTRAYFENANRLPGFLAEFDMVEMFKEAEKNGILEDVTKYQHIEYSTLWAKL